MDPTFQSRTWKAAALVTYLGMHMGAIFITFVLPATFLCMGETNIDDVALHSQSFSMISHWLVGLGGITFFVCTISLISTITTSRIFRIIMTCLLTINIILAVSLLTWGLIESKERKEYLQDSWNEMDPVTKGVIQKHYSCCGFESYEKTSLVNCLAVNDATNETATWPDGCYGRVTSYNLPAPKVTFPNGDVMIVGEPVVNLFLLGFVIPFTFLIFTLCLCAILFVVALNERDEDYQDEVFENKNAPKHENGVGNEVTTNETTSNGSTSKISAIFDPEQEQVNIHDRGKSEGSKERRWYQKIPDAISTALEDSFYWLGMKVGQHPKMTILYSLLLAVTFSLGLFQRLPQEPGSRGFLSEDSTAIKELVKVSTYFRSGYIREHYILIVDENNLLAENKFKSMLKLDNQIKTMNDSEGLVFNQICAELARKCRQKSVFELWNYNIPAMSTLDTNGILTKLNGDLTSPVFGNQLDLSTILGDISRNSTGHIIGAKAHLMHYVTGRKDDEWEMEFIDVARAENKNITVYVEARGSRVFEANSYTEELPLLFGGFGLIFIYILLMTGKFSLLEHRAYIAMMGVATSGLAMSSGIGLSASLGFEWSVIHLVAPFLVIGIGVDDMFILIQSWNVVEDNEEARKKSIAEKAGRALKTAGVSITVTSVTDLVAFAVGSSSQLGSFASFSVYVALCIILLFFLQCTLFLACTVLDQRRRAERYDACLACCYRHGDDYKPSKCSRREIFASFFEDVLGKIVQYLPVQISVILLTLSVTSLMIWGFTKLQVSFDPDWYLPSGSYVIDFNNQLEKYFSGGLEASVSVIGGDLYEEREKLHILYQKLQNTTVLNEKYLISWFENYAAWMRTDKNVTDLYAENAFLNSTYFYSSITEFIKGKGRVFTGDVAFNRSGVLVASKFQVRHRPVQNKVENVDIMLQLRDICASVGFSGDAFPYDRKYFNLYIMDIIRQEVYRNLGITLLCVFIMVLPMIASIQMSFWVVLCVVFTIIDVAGSMYFAGLTIETSTIITLLLSVGLAVDYAAHVGHKFLTLKGTRKMRVRVTMGQIGPAVFNGGFSTFLALVLLSASQTYSYKVFFTVFVCVVAYGLWNGLVFLPCILGLMGPAPHITAEEARLSQRHHHRKNKIQTSSMDEIRTNNSIERT